MNRHFTKEYKQIHTWGKKLLKSQVIREIQIKTSKYYPVSGGNNDRGGSYGTSVWLRQQGMSPDQFCGVILTRLWPCHLQVQFSSAHPPSQQFHKLPSISLINCFLLKSAKVRFFYVKLRSLTDSNSCFLKIIYIED